MIVALEVLAVLAMVIGAVFYGAISLSSTTKRDARSKRALAAAEAGLQVARYRVNRLVPSNPSCLTDQAVAPSFSTGECPSYTGNLGNGVTYTYWVTDTSQGAECGGTSTGETRCITSVGTAGGISRRLQMRVGHDDTQYTFPLAGIMGFDGIHVGNGTSGTPVVINGALGSDGLIDLGNNVNVPSGCVITGNGSTHLGNGTTCPVRSPNPPLDCSPPKFRPCAVPISEYDFAPTFAANMNATGISKISGSSTWTYTPGTTNATWPTGDARTLTTVTGSLSLVLQSGDYNFCRWSLGNNTQILLAGPSTHVRIFFDSSYRSPAGCAAFQSLPLKAGNGANLNPAWSGNPSPSPAQLEIYVHGQPNQTNASSTADLANANVINAVLYAPNTKVTMGNGASPSSNSIWNGAVIGQTIDVGNQFTYNWDTSAANLSTAISNYTRMLWTECQSQPTTPSDPESGC